MPAAPPYGPIAERRLIERLLNADAVGAGSAHSLENLRSIEERRLRRLIAAGYPIDVAKSDHSVRPHLSAKYRDYKNERYQPAIQAIYDELKQ